MAEPRRLFNGILWQQTSTTAALGTPLRHRPSRFPTTHPASAAHAPARRPPPAHPRPWLGFTKSYPIRFGSSQFACGTENVFQSPPSRHDTSSQRHPAHHHVSVRPHYPASQLKPPTSTFAHRNLTAIELNITGLPPPSRIVDTVWYRVPDASAAVHRYLRRLRSSASPPRHSS